MRDLFNPPDEPDPDEINYQLQQEAEERLHSELPDYGDWAEVNALPPTVELSPEDLQLVHPLSQIRDSLDQLRGISLDSLNRAGQYGAVDRVQRAIESLESVEAELEQ